MYNPHNSDVSVATTGGKIHYSDVSVAKTGGTPHDSNSGVNRAPTGGSLKEKKIVLKSH